MQLVVADANILLGGLVDPDSLHRKLLVVFAYGKLHSDLLIAGRYRDEIAQLLVERSDARLGTQWDPDGMVARTEAHIALLAERLPEMTPSEWGLVISPPITKEVEEVLMGGRSGFGPQDPSVVADAVALVTAIRPGGSGRRPLVLHQPPALRGPSLRQRHAGRDRWQALEPGCSATA